MGETTVGHVAGEVVRALYGAGYMESTIGQYRKSIRALERYAGGPDAVYTRGLGAGFAASTFSELFCFNVCSTGSAVFFRSVG